MKVLYCTGNLFQAPFDELSAGLYIHWHAEDGDGYEVNVWTITGRSRQRIEYRYSIIEDALAERAVRLTGNAQMIMSDRDEYDLGVLQQMLRNRAVPFQIQKSSVGRFPLSDNNAVSKVQLRLVPSNSKAGLT